MAKILSWSLVFAVAMFYGSQTGSAQAAQPKAKPKASIEQKFKALDKDGDGKVSKKEFVGLKEGEALQKAEAAFKRLDKNHDGQLTLQEFKAPKAKKPGKKKAK